MNRLFSGNKLTTLSDLSTYGGGLRKVTQAVA
jgi:hypothetical protein